MIGLSSEAGHRVAAPLPLISWSVAMTDRGLVCGAGSVLARMKSGAGGAGRLAVEADEDRVLAMLSVVAGKLLSAPDVMHHIDAASMHWRHGDKALANLRLVFARLPQPADAAAVDRLALTEKLLDDGLKPDSLMKALWPSQAEDLRRYNRDEPRVPAGYGIQSGEWEFAGESSAHARPRRNGAMVVATSNKETPAQQLLHEEHELAGTATFEEEVEHHRSYDPLSGMPGGIGPGKFARESIPAGPAKRPSPTQRLRIDSIGREHGCHTCGTKDPGTPTGKFVGDHQPPTKFAPPRVPRRYFPQCLPCSHAQGGRLRSILRERR